MIFNMTGGGSGSGATLVVSCPANVTVTVSKDDKSYTKNSGNLGSATFKGLATGEWTVTIEGNEQTATKNITITADYAITMAFFAAYINITYPANSTCTVKTSGGVTVASDTNTDSSAKTWTATVGATGTYTITATSTSDSSKTKSTTVSITADGQSSSVTLRYELTLYDSGDEFEDITGGWVMRGSGSIVKNTDYITISAIAWGQNGWASTANMIDLTDISTIKFDVYSGSTYPRPGYPTIAITKNTSGINFGDGTGMTSRLTLTAGRTTRSIDVSSLSGSYYVIFGGLTGDDGAPNIEVYKVWGVPK